MKTKKLLIPMFALISHGVWAADLTLDEAIRIAMGEAPALKEVKAVESELSWKKVETRAELLPKITLNAQHAFDVRYQTAPVTIGGNTLFVSNTTPKTNYGAEASWTLFNGFSNWSNMLASQLDHEASHYDVDRRTFELSKKVEVAYYNVIAATKLAEVSRQNVETLTESHTRAKARLKSGVATAYEVLRVEVLLNETMAEQELAEDNIIIAKKNLTKILGRNDFDFTITGELPDPQKTSEVKNLKMISPIERSDLKALSLKEEAVASRRAAAWGAWSPTVSFYARYDRYDNTNYNFDFNEKGFYRDAYSVGLQFKWALFDGGATYAKPYIAAAQEERVQANYKAAVLDLPTDFELWQRRYLYFSRYYETRKSDVTRSAESLRIANSGYGQGAKTINDILDAESDLFKARAGVIKAQMDAEEALTKLELTIGKEI